MAQRFAINGDVPHPQQLTDLVQPLDQTFLQSQGIESVKDSPERVLRGYPMGQLQEPLKPIFAVAGEGSDIAPGVGIADDGTDGHRDDVGEYVPFAAVDT